MSVSMFGAITAADVTDIIDDGEALKAAAGQLLAALESLHTNTTRAAHAWEQLPSVLQAEALTPALAPLMTPATQLAEALHTAAQQFSTVANRAATELAALKQEHDSLVHQITGFHDSAPGTAAAHIARQAATGDIAGALTSLTLSWKEIPEIAANELALRWKVNTHNTNVETTLTTIAAQIDAIDTPGNTHLPDLRTAAASMPGGSGDTWWDRAAEYGELIASLAWSSTVGVTEEATKQALPYVEEGLSTAANAVLSFGNAMRHHGDDDAALLGGGLLAAGGAIVGAAGLPLDATGIGAIAGGAELNAAGIAMMGAGGTLMGGGASDLAKHASTDDAEKPLPTDQVKNATAPKTDQERVEDLNKQIAELKKTDPGNWRIKALEGQKFNFENHGRYPENEVRLENGKILDSYKPRKEIVSRKFTQLSDIKPETAKSYINEIDSKYAPGEGIKGGGELAGDEILEVPVQKAPIPEDLLKYADSRIPPVTIRDVTGHEYN